MEVAIILAAGKSTRFGGDIPKQLFPISGRELITYSVSVLSEVVDEVIVVTNSNCYKQMKNLLNVDVIKSDTETRLESIKTGLDHISGANNVIFHDAARPFITVECVRALLESSREYLCSQYYFPLLNGLIKCDKTGVSVVSREQYKQLVTPQILDYRLAKDLFDRHINQENCEIVPVLDKLKIRYNLIEGHQRYLRKITTLEDVL